MISLTKVAYTQISATVVIFHGLRERPGFQIMVILHKRPMVLRSRPNIIKHPLSSSPVKVRDRQAKLFMPSTQSMLSGMTGTGHRLHIRGVAI